DRHNPALAPSPATRASTVVRPRSAASSGAVSRAVSVARPISSSDLNLNGMLLRTRRTPSGFVESCLPSPVERSPSGPGETTLPHSAPSAAKAKETPYDDAGTLYKSVGGGRQWNG